MKGLFKARIQRKPWLEGVQRCFQCDRRFLLERCWPRCEVIADYQARKGLLFVEADGVESVFVPSDTPGPTDRSDSFISEVLW